MVKVEEQQLSDNTNKWQEMESKYLMRTFKRVPVILERGEGVYVWDDKGNKYLDMVGGWAVNSIGHCHPVILKALNEQAAKLIQVSNQFYTIPQLELAKLLIEKSCLDRVFFCNSGAEANEGAIKLARRYGKLHLNGAFEIITTYGSFHGRTLAMVAATGQSKFQEPYVPLPNGFVNVEYNDIEAIKKATNSNTCAIMLEPVQGEGGVNVPEVSYLKEIRKWCDEKNILLILDEIQTGIGRLGKMFGYELFGVEPDIMTLAKGMGGGVPIGAILATDKAAVFTPGEHGSTFGGNPLICATSLSVLRYIIDNNLCEQAKNRGEYLKDKLNTLKTEYDFIKEIKGTGLLIGIVFTSDISERLVLKCLESRLLVNAVKPNIMRFMPPLIIEENHIDEAVNKLKEVFETEKRNV
jgi:predicted acetylornithine/succinylornithine family transaminase